MGDQIYPGILLGMIPREVTETSLTHVLQQRLGTGRAIYRYGAPDIKFISKRESECRYAVVSGILLPYREIRERLARAFYRGTWPFCILDKDFGLLRKEQSLFMIFENYLLQERLRFSHGDVSTLLIIKQERLGILNRNLDRIHKKYYFLPADSSNAFVNVRIDGREYLGSYRNPAKNETTMHFLFRTSAFENIGNTVGGDEFHKGRSFFHKKINDGSDSEKIFFQPRAPFQLLNSDEPSVIDLVAAYGYIPIEAFHPDAVNTAKLEVYRNRPGVCLTCWKEFKILGIHPDLAYVAQICGCIQSSKSDNAWPGEDFFRATEHPSYRKLYGRHADKAIEMDEVLIPLIEGIKPSYSSPDEFWRTIGNAYRFEASYQKRLFTYKQRRSGKVIYFAVVDQVTKPNDKEKIIARMDVHIKNGSPIWSPSSQHQIGSVSVVLDPSRDDRPIKLYMPNPDAHAKIYRGRLCGIRLSDHDRFTVQLQMTLPKSVGFGVGQRVQMIPHPSSTEVTALQNIVSQWKKFHQVRARFAEPFNAVIFDAYFHVRAPLPCLTSVEYNLYSIRVILEPIPFLDEIEQLLEDLYLAGDIEIPGSPSYTATMRITSGTMEKDGRFTLTGVCALRVPRELHAGGCTIRFWAVRLRHSVALNALPGEVEEDEEEEDDDEEDHYFDSDASTSSENDEEYQEEEGVTIANRHHCLILSPYHGLDLYRDPREDKDRELEVTLKLDNHSVLQNWMFRPPNLDLSILDFLLTDSKKVQQPALVLDTSPREHVNNELVDTIWKRLNPYQQEAVTQMEKHKFNFCQGPPGTGKTNCGALGILHLLAQETGVVVVVCPSNYACEVIYERLTYLCQELDVAVQIMYSQGRERAPRFQHDAHDRDGHLRSAVRRRQGRRGDNAMRQILEICARDGESALTQEQDEEVRQHIRKLEKYNLKDSSVVISTVAAASDGRLASLKRHLQREGRDIAALVVDECSLLTLPGSVLVLSLSPKRVWFLGDHRQLPPYVQSQTSFNAGLNISLMEMAFACEHFQNKATFTVLNEQYRMDVQISAIVSDVSYGGLVKDNAIVKTRDTAHVYTPLFFQSFPWAENSKVALYTYESRPGQDHETHCFPSYYNQKEIDIVVSLVEKLTSSGIPLQSIRVITPYEKQREFIKRELEWAYDKLRDTNVSTVDSVQGTEADVIICSFVRSNPRNEVGFLRDRRRLNVAISRARYALFLVGDEPMLQRCTLPEVRKLMAAFKKNGVTSITVP